MSRVVLGAAMCLAFLQLVTTENASAQVVADDVQCSGCVGKTDIGVNQVNSRNIKLGGVKTQNLKKGAVTSGKLADGADTFSKLAEDVAFTRVRIVSLFGNGADNTANGLVLLDVLSDVAAASPAPSGTNPWLIKLERGIYDVGATPLAMVPFVAIEGAGRHATTITGDVDSFFEGVINGADDAALRLVAVEHQGSTSSVAIVIRTDASGFSMSDVAVKIDSATANQAFGIFADGGSLSLTNVSVQTQAATGQSQGIRGQSGAELHMVNTWVHNESGNVGNPAALELRDSSATGFGVLFSSNIFGLLAIGNSLFELFDGTVIGGRETANFTGSFTCVAIADGDFTARKSDCT